MNWEGVPSGVPRENGAGLPPGRAGALWPGGRGGAPAGGREAGRARHFRWLPGWLAGWLLERAAKGAEGACGPGTRIPRSPLRPTRLGHGRQVGGARAAMAHVTETPGPRDRDPGAREAGWGPPAADPRSAVRSRWGWGRGVWPVFLGGLRGRLPEGDVGLWRSGAGSGVQGGPPVA